MSAGGTGSGPGGLARPGAREIAAGVRSGRIRARAVLEEHLARIAAAEDEVHAFNLLMADRARDAADRIDGVVAAGHDPGVMAGVPVALKDNLCTHGVADHLLVADPRRMGAPL